MEVHIQEDYMIYTRCPKKLEKYGLRNFQLQPADWYKMEQVLDNAKEAYGRDITDEEFADYLQKFGDEFFNRPSMS